MVIKRYRIILGMMGLILSAVTWTGCSNDDSSTESGTDSQSPQQENQAPLDFNLLGLDGGDFEVELSPEFSWEAAADPDGDPIAYDLFLDRNADPETRVGNELEVTTFQLENVLNRNTEYHWKVDAKDGNGGVTSSEIRTFQTRTIKVPISAAVNNAQFSPRALHSAFEFQNNLWLLGPDVWRSPDGLQWINMVSETDFAPEAGSPALSFDDKLFVLKGAANEVWFSADGSFWSPLNALQPFSERLGHTAVVFRDKIWVIGGQFQQGSTVFSYNDIWASDNGRDWELVTLSADFPERFGHNCFVYDNKIWIMGGYSSNTGLLSDIWNSSDGKSWNKVTSISDFPPRRYAGLAVWDNDLILIGGEGGFTGTSLSNTNQIESLDDVWHSTDGENWELIGSITPRTAHTLTDFDGKLFLIGGYIRKGFNNFDTERQNDIWIIQ